jgi:hypothetical protein
MSARVIERVIKKYEKAGGKADVLCSQVEKRRRRR